MDKCLSNDSYGVNNLAIEKPQGLKNVIQGWDQDMAQVENATLIKTQEENLGSSCLVNDNFLKSVGEEP